tara:strand:- start:260 stop:406 length:147 start_codon:yes stop_codon:yes gene_type:complete
MVVMVLQIVQQEAKVVAVVLVKQVLIHQALKLAVLVVMVRQLISQVQM